MSEADEGILCVACGSGRVTSSMIDRSIRLPFMDEVVISVHIEECSNCGSSGDFLSRNDPIIESAILNVEKMFVRQTLDLFSEDWGISFVSIQRIFTPEATALLRLIRALPGLIVMAEEGYSRKWHLNATEGIT
jgi:galactitol-specific phosphotransferase system IIB component